MTFTNDIARAGAKTICTLFTVALLAMHLPAAADEGHAHGEAPAQTSAPAQPRFTAHSDLFEAVGVLDAQAFSVLIDQYETNAPVLGAQVEIESGSLKLPLVFDAEQAGYSMPAEPFKTPGTYPITLTVIAGDQTDLLTGELVVPDPETGHAHDATPKSWGLWAALLALLAAAAAVVWRLRRHSRRTHHTARV